QAGRVRVERAAMANFLDAEVPADGIDHVMRGWPCRFVDDERAIQRREVLHASVGGRLDDYTGARPKIPNPKSQIPKKSQTTKPQGAGGRRSRTYNDLVRLSATEFR